MPQFSLSYNLSLSWQALDFCTSFSLCKKPILPSVGSQSEQVSEVNLNKCQKYSPTSRHRNITLVQSFINLFRFKTVLPAEPAFRNRFRFKTCKELETFLFFCNQKKKSFYNFKRKKTCSYR